MAYSFFSHTGDIGVTLSAESLDALFADAALALTDTLSDHRLIAVTRSTAVELHAAAVDLLLIDWINELIYRLETDGLIAARACVAITGGGDDWTLAGTVEGDTLNTVRHPVKTLVKAATYHALEVSRTGGEWHATVVLDV